VRFDLLLLVEEWLIEIEKERQGKGIKRVELVFMRRCFLFF